MLLILYINVEIDKIKVLEQRLTQCNRLTGIVPNHGFGNIRIGPNNSNSPVTARGQWQGWPTILKQNNALSGRLKGQLLVGRSANIPWAQIPVGLGRRLPIKHSQSHLDRNCIH